MSIETIIQGRQAHINELLEQQLSGRYPEPGLQEAMQYAVLNGGKRMRAMLAYAAAEAVGGHFSCADSAASAVEMIHAYSLVHDDLPAMDNDSLRRGKPSCHVAYDEATAILVGDGLLTLAFEVLAESASLSVPDAIRIRMIGILARAAGPKGMVAGQSLDIQAAGGQLDEAGLSTMHRLKTGALIEVSVLLGALSTGDVQEGQLEQLARFAENAGLAFQVKDDILDVEGETDTLGKQQGKDQLDNKPTYTSMLGLEGARSRLDDYYQKSLQALSGLESSSDNLRGLAKYIIERNY